MTEYEAASLAVAQANLDVAQASLAIAQAGLEVAWITAWATVAYAVISLLVGAGQIWIIWYGIRTMAKNSEERERDHERRHKETMAALDAQMLALRTLIERTAPPRAP